MQKDWAHCCTVHTTSTVCLVHGFHGPLIRTGTGWFNTNQNLSSASYNHHGFLSSSSEWSLLIILIVANGYWLIERWSCTCSVSFTSPICLNMIENRCLRLQVGRSLGRLSKFPQITVSLECAPLRKSCVQPSRSGSFPIEVLRWKRMPGTPYRIDWPFVIILEKIGKLRFRSNHKCRANYTAVCSPASAAKECTGNPECLAASEERVNRAISHRSSVGYVTPQIVLLTFWIKALG